MPHVGLLDALDYCVLLAAPPALLAGWVRSGVKYLRG